ncbi:hypothetical protein [Arthrobacter sp. 2MCAF14]|uniref:hypothetical protein n=1 Tax=Arthrobacter sp. 2MCAF14 TaxID=3232982 RepID=UPI003F904BE8
MQPLRQGSRPASAPGAGSAVESGSPPGPGRDHVRDDVYVGQETTPRSRVHVVGSHSRIGAGARIGHGVRLPGVLVPEGSSIPDAGASRGSTPGTRKAAHGPDSRMAA